MPSVQIKNVPEDVHRTLRIRAAEAGQSLQEYLLALLVDEARTESMNTVLDRIGSRRGVRMSFDDAVKWLHEERRRG